MNRYKCSDGTWVTKAYIDRKVSEAKRQKLQNQLNEYSYNFCESCGIASGVYLDCSHNKPVKKCQEEGMSELAWDLDNITILCRQEHQEKDGLDLKFKS